MASMCEMADFRVNVMALVCTEPGPHTITCCGCNKIDAMVVRVYRGRGQNLLRLYKPSLWQTSETLACSLEMVARGTRMVEGNPTIEEFAETFYEHVVQNNNWNSQKMKLAMATFAARHRAPDDSCGFSVWRVHHPRHFLGLQCYDSGATRFFDDYRISI